MKLFQRTLLSFAGVIFLQAVLAGAALAVIFGSMQTEDATRELKTEASAAYEVFNAWKLAFWKDINTLAEDERLIRLISGSPYPLSDSVVSENLRQAIVGSAAESVYVKYSGSREGKFLFRDPRDRYAPDGARLSVQRPHPYIEIVSTEGGLWFAGIVRLAPAARRPLDVFLLKRIDESLVSQLSYDPMVAVIVSDGIRDIVGRYSASAPAEGGAKVLENARSFITALNTHRPEGAYAIYPWRDGAGGGYAAIVQRAGSATTLGGEAPLTVSALLTYELYGARAARLNGTVVAVSLIVALSTILAALGFTRSIADPVRRLSEAMHRIREGDYGATAQGSAGGEIGELLAGFNGMARKLESDRSELDAYIEDIEGLKEYRERVIDAIREGLAVADSDGRIESANRAFLTLFGLARAEELTLGSIAPSVFDAELQTRLGETACGGMARGSTLRRMEGARSFDVKLYPLTSAPRHEHGRCIVIVEDVTERLASEARLVQADRLASMSMLSAGVAHEINNPLSSILSNVQNLLSESPGGESGKVLRLVERETMRIARIVRQLLDFSSPRFTGVRAEDPVPRCNPVAVIKNLVLLVGYPLRAEGRVDIISEMDEACPEVAVTEDELTQVMLNLMKNALEAVGEHGRVVIRAAESPAGVRIEVSDSGAGIPEEIRGRIFDPFFTTKSTLGPDHSGVGLGLSVVYGIVTTRGGSIVAESGSSVEAGHRGATIRVELPAARD